MKTVLITGCSSGIGFETALLFARKGYKVFASMRNTKNEAAKKLQAISNKELLNIQIIEIDITSSKSVELGITQIDVGEHIDILVNNAGFGFVGPVEAFTVDEIKEQYETNVFGTFRMIKAVSPIMRNIKSGKIINISSINGLVAFPFWGIYASSKFAIEAFTESLKFELEPFGIDVALVEPGSFSTDFTFNRKMPLSLENMNSPYKKWVFSFFSKFDKIGNKFGESYNNSLFNSQRVARKIFEISNQKKSKLHNRIGIDSHVYYFAKKYIPNALYQYFLHKFYSSP
jgi:short-subunit dehydrogenase